MKKKIEQCKHEYIATGTRFVCCKCGNISKKKPRTFSYELEKLPPEWRQGGIEEYPVWICSECAMKRGGKPIKHMATWHKGICSVCREEKSITEPRDFKL